MLFYCAFILIIDCNNFFLKFELYIPPDHWLLQVRLSIWAFSAICASKEFYEYLTNKYCYRVGPFIWLATLCMLLELSIALKHGPYIFDTPFPTYVKVIWIVLGSLIIYGGIYAYRNEQRIKNLHNELKRSPSGEFNPNDPKVDIHSPVFTKLSSMDTQTSN